jgi:hypothetical protein
MFGILLAGLAACSNARDPSHDPATSYLCADDQRLDIIQTEDLAIVRIGERIFNLQSRPGSVGARYADGSATLIIDQGIAVFVYDDGEQRLSCRLDQDG